MRAIHYAGPLRWRRGETVVDVGGGFAACTTGDAAHRIRKAGNHTYDRASVTCKTCLTRIKWSDETPRDAWKT